MNSADNNKRDFVKQFSSWMTEDGLAVDIYSGIKDLYKAVSWKDQVLAQNAYYKTGMAFIKQQVLDRLGRFADNIMVEYSLVASTLDPDRPNTLQCCSFINSDKNDITGFRQTISKKYSLCIEKVSTQIGYSIYQHPHFLYDIPIEKDSTVWENNKNARSKYILTKVSESDSLVNEIIAPDSDKGSPYLSIEGKDLSIGVFPLSRSYPEMVHSAQEWTIKKENKHTEAKSLKELQTILHQYCYTNISHRNNAIKSSYYISFPVFGAIASNQLPQYKVGNGSPLQGIGACFIYFEPKKDANINDDELHEQVSKLVYYVGDIIRFISVNYLFNLGLQLQENARREAIKSAISAIMSRNMSHNLGSHYMYYTKAYLEQLANSVNDIAPDIRGAAKVLGYVQARMDYLATVISNDKYPYGAVNFKSQIYDELTVDDFSHRHFREDKNKRTTNFLLTNLILSENFTRPDVRSDEDISSNSNQLFLHVKLLKEDNHYVDFTGTWHSSKLKWFKDRRRENPNLPTLTSEEDIKNQLSSLNIALPGGSMSCHALFNVVENFIRNSAKYLQNDINKEEGLICTLAIAPNPDNSSLIDITIYDNKKNANKIVDISRNLTLYELIICKLESLVIIDDQDKISKDNKGFKEMLFSSIWMRAYTFGNDKTYADIVSEINNVSCGESKIELIERYGFSLVRVQETSDGGISINNRKMPLGGECNLGLTITLPVFKQCDTILLSGVKSVDVNNILNIMADIVEVDKEFFKSVYHHVFTRPLLKDVAAGMSIYEKYHKVVTDRFPDIDKYALSLEKAEDHYNSTPKEFQIFFKRHMSTAGNADPCEYEGYAYADTISGGNFTITLLDLFKKGYENGVYKSDDDRIFALKIKESALTRITVIDERLFNSTEKKDYPWLSLKNVRVLNYDDSFDESLKEDASDDESCISSIFVGNSFGDSRDKTHFLTIHLGLIEKILKNSKFVNTLINKELENEAGCGTYNPLDPIRVRTFMKLLRMHYSEGVQRDIYIAIHSGRGNYSAELEGPLSKYPFISLSALENAFNNSKYQLSQLLYNTVYIGKGFANNI